MRGACALESSPAYPTKTFLRESAFTLETKMKTFDFEKEKEIEHLPNRNQIFNMLA